ncbi:GNVR domain-containing protein [Salmonella enterica]|uniref:GNVR domain-containing protein n=1 Tax=Salmonella enterica TaxID=28901 RepID=UPI0002BC5B85|nr:GNVR domain-containing protein [Salmonella enterica]
MQGENSEIDLVDVSLFLIRKWLNIVITTIIFVAIGYVFVSVQHDTKVVSITIKPNLDTSATYALCGYTNDIQCKTTVILNRFSRFLPTDYKNKISFEAKNQLILFKSEGREENVNNIISILKNSVNKMAAWYIDDGDIKRYSLHKNMLQTETYAKLSLLSEAVKNNANIEVIDVAITPKYKMRLVLVLCGLMGLIFSITGLLCKRALTEYRVEKKKMKDRA